MKNKTMRNKWTKKLRAMIISLSVAFVVAMGGACAAIGLSMSDKNDRFGGGYIAGSVADETTQINVGTTIEVSSADMWADVIEAAAESSADSYVQAKLVKNITATSGSFGEGTEITGAYFNGALNVPAGSYVVLDLNGYTVNRGLTEAVEGGTVITNSGNLIIKDGSEKGTGKITGGNTTQNGGGIYSALGSLTVLSGTIKDNTAKNGGGVYVRGGTFLMTGGVIEKNIAYGANSRGGGFFGGDGIVIKFYGGKITDNKCDQFGGGVFLNGSTAYFGMPANTVDNNEEIISTCEISNNYGAQGGAGIDNGSGAKDTIYLHGAKIINNSAVGGNGGIWVGTDDTLYFSKGEISGNSVTKAGGGISMGGGTLIMTGGTISGNTAGTTGGGIHVGSGASVTMSGGTISGNTASTFGGGIYSEAPGVYEEKDGKQVLKQAGLTINGEVEISNNTAGSRGGGVAVKYGSLSLKSGAISGNTTTDSGGAGVYFDGDSSVFEMTGGEISDNVSSSGGGGVLLGNLVENTKETASRFIFSGGKISGNTSKQNGGGGIYTLSNYYTRIEISGDTLISGNVSRYNMNGGGGIAVNGRCALVMNGGEISDNTSGSNGGGIYSSIDDNSITINSGTISGNTAAKSGGGIYVASTVDSFIFKSGTVSGNTSGESGGGIYTSAATVIGEEGNTTNNPQITGNTSDLDGGGLGVAANGSMTISGATISENVATGNGGGIYTGSGSGKIEITDTDIIGNTANYGGGIYNGKASTLIDVTITDNCAFMGGGIYADAYSVMLGGTINVTGNFGKKYDLTVKKYVADTSRKDNLCINSTVSFIMSGENIFNRNDSRIGVYTTKRDSVPTFVNGKIFSESSVDFIGSTYLKTIFSADRHDMGQDLAHFEYGPLGQDNYYLYFLILGNISNSPNSYTNAALWNYAAENSSDSKPIQVDLPESWSWTETEGFGYRLGAKGYDSYGRLVVPEGANIVLNLNGKLIDRKQSASDSAYGNIFIVNGTLTIIGSGTITGGNMQGYGGAAYVTSTGKLIISGGTFTNNIAYQGGVVYVDGGTLIMNGGEIRNNFAGQMTSYGGAVYLKENSTFEMHGGSIHDNAANGSTNVYGGGIYASKSTVTIDGGSIYNNSANITGSNGLNGCGGGIYLGWCTTTIGGSAKIYGNTAGRFGGGIYADLGTVKMTGGEIYSNRVKYTAEKRYGGAGVYVYGGAVFTMTGGKIRDNRAENNNSDSTKTQAAYGGGVFVGPGGTFKLGDVVDGKYVGNGEISGNYAVANGGGIYAYTVEGGDLKIYSGTIKNNTAKNGGGVYVEQYVPAYMYGGTISGNQATNGNGGGVYVGTIAAFTMTGGKISGNIASQYGGGLYSEEDVSNNPTFKIRIKGEVSGNTAVDGGGIYVKYGKLEIQEGSKISGNTATTSGGGIYLLGISTPTFTIDGTKITGNKAGAYGAGIYVTEMYLNITDCEISGNTVIGNEGVGRGGGVYAVECYVKFESSVIQGNTAIDGGGIYVAAGAGNGFTSTVIEGNTASKNGGGIYSGAATSFADGEIKGNTAGENGGGLYYCGASVTFELSGTAKVYNNNADQYGGGVYVLGGTGGSGAVTFKMSGGTVSGNEAARGGGIYVAALGIAQLNGGTITENTAAEGGGVAVVNGKLYMGTAQQASTVVISNNTATANGGGIYTHDPAPVKGVVVDMYGGTISGNSVGTTSFGGGGILVNGGCTFNMYSGEISDNTVDGNGGGVYCRGTFNMYGGTISGNTSTVDATTGGGGGVFVAAGATFNMYDGEISGNEAVRGGGIFNVGTLSIEDGVITGNYAQKMGAGILQGSATVATISGGEIYENTSATIGGGIYVSTSITLALSGDAKIYKNVALRGGAGVHVNGTLNVSGSANVTENTLENGTASNVYLPSGKKITVASKLSDESEIGVKAEDSTVEFTSGFGNRSTLEHPNMAFSADEPQYVVGTNGKTGLSLEAKFAECYNINLAIYGKDGVSTGKTGLVKADKDTNVTFTVTKTKFTFKSTQGGRTNMETAITVPEVAGYTPYLYNPADHDAEIKSGEVSVITPVAGDIDLRIGYKADTDTEYKVYYILQQPNGSYTDKTNPTELQGMTSVKVYTGKGTTDGPLSYKDAEGKALVPTGGWTNWADYDQYTFDSINVENPTIAGEGTSYVLVKMKLNEYTVSYSASGATPSLQTQTYKYGATLNNTGIQAPTKDMNTFAGWYFDADCTQEVKFDGSDAEKVSANIQLYAKFDTQHFKLIFNLNVGEGTNQLPTGNANKTIVYPNAKGGILNGKVSWDVDSLFPADEKFGFKVSEGEGKYEIDYTVNNVNSNKRLNVKPSAIGFTFDGWYVGEATTETTVIRTPSSGTQTIELTARWTPTAYTIRFDAQDGSKVTTKKPANLTAWSAILPTPAERAGYEFLGWFPTTDKNHAKYQEVENEFSTVTNSDGDYVFSVADFAKSGLYGNADGYTLGSLTLYGIWKSQPVYIEVDENERGELSFYKKVEDGEEQISSDDLKVSINDEIRVEVKAPVGYEFKNLVLGDNKTQRDGLTTFTVSSRYIDSTTNTLSVKVNYTEKRYSIDYDTDGGRINDASYAKIYTASNINATEDVNRAKLPSLVVKNGYAFDGWIFASTASDEVEAEPAHLPVPEGESTYGAALYLLQPFALNGDGKTYRDVKLKAVWKAEESEVYLYNATYLSGEYTKPADNHDADYYLINSKVVADDIVTGATISITSPVRESFTFLGWATTRNGTVVYPATKYDASGRALPIEYTVSAHKDTNGNLLNRNNLYAVWHVADLDYVIMSATNNGSQYGGNGITMSAKSSREYDSDSGIKLTYTWYKIFDGMYDQCFIEKDYLDQDENKIYVDAEGALVAYEDKNGNYFDAEKQPLEALPEGATKLTYQEFNPLSVGTACEVKRTLTDKNPNDAISYTVTNVADCGMYVCVVKVTAGEFEGNDTAYGEIEITMTKAVYGGLTFADKKVTYNLSSRSNAIEVKQGDKSATVDSDGLKTFTLPDGSKVVVTYRYFVGEGELREEITDLSQIKNVGTYHVVASFAFAVGGDKGNYEALEELEADLIIEADPLSALEFIFMHDGEKSELDFSGAYDGKAYGVDVEIKDKVDISANAQLVTEVDDVAVELRVYKVTDDGDVPVTGETVEAGTYYVEIVGLTGAAKDNYVLGEIPTTRKEYTINKMKYDVVGHIQFKDAEVEFDNETHTIEFTVDEGFELPSTVTVKYTTTYVAEDASFDADNSRKPNTVDDNNGGRYAGTYTVTVEFTDSASSNYEELESKTATLTIKKAKFFDFYNKDGKDLLRDAGFVSASYAYKVKGKYNPYINGGMLNTTEDFALTYDYYLVNETTQERTMLGSGTHEQLLNAGSEDNKGDLISRAGKYEIVAQIKYVSPLYKNNFEEIPESERTITYVIREVAVESVTVVWADDFDKVVKLGEAFNYDWIKAIKVKFAQDNTETNEVATQADDDENTLTLTSKTDIALAGIKFEKKNNVEQTTFWHVGNFNVTVSFYGVEIAEAEVFTVKEEIKNVTLRYSTDGENFKTVGSDGLEMDGSDYSFRVYYSCTDESGATGTKWTAATVADDGLVLGANALGVTEDYYTFAVEGGISIALYKVISSVTWEYSLDGNSWAAIPETGLVYAGKAYQIRAKFDDNGEQTALAKTDSGIEVLNANTGSDGYVMEVGRSGSYKVTAQCSFRVVPKVLEFDWDSSELKYNMFSRSPVATATGIAEVDKDSITLSYEYYDEDGNKLASVDEVVKVGKYSAKVVLRGDSTARSNYTLTGSETAEQKFEIVQAEVAMAEVYYSESNYGKNITFAGNGQLRLGALKADFGENTVVSGQFSFITNYQPATGEYEIVDGTALASLIASVGDANIQYVYKPNDKNFKEKVGTVTLDVREQKAKTGAGALSVEFGKDAIQFYLVNQKLDTYGIEVYRLYESAYQENGKWYGLRREVSNPVFRVDGYNGSLENYKITSQDLSSEKIVLRAIDGGNSGTLDVPVVDKTASALEVFSTDHRTTYYVGETPDFSDITFRVLFGQGEKPLEGLKIGTVKMKKVNGADVDTFTVTEEGTFTVTFMYFNVPKEVTFTAKPKEDLGQHIVKPTDTILTWKGDDTKLDPPQLTFKIGDKTYGQNELEGVIVTVTVKQGDNIATLAKEGEYQVIYSFAVTNPRFETPSTIALKVTVTKNPYKVEFTKPEIKSAFYTGNSITIPKITIDGTVKDTTAGNAPVPTSYVEISYKINGKDAVTDRDWQKVNADEYKVDVIVKVKAYNGHSEYTAGTDSYVYVIKQAENDHANVNIALPDNKIILLGEGANFNFDVTADFGEETAVLKYSRTRDGVYTTDKPNAIGIWFVKAEIPETSNYKKAEKIESFEVRKADIASESGSISGGHGIGEGWKLEIKQMESGDVSKVSISKQNVLDGYTVVLKNHDDVQISGEGEYTVRVKLSEELSGRTDLKVFFKDANGKSVERKASVKDGFVEFKTSEFGTFIITSAVAEAKSPTGLIAGVSVLGVIAVGLIVACILVFLKKRKGA